MTTSSRPAYPAGTVITGKWHNNRFVIRRVLGQGGNGIVYLVHKAGYRNLYALKMGYDTLDLQSEINVLTSLQSQSRRQDGLKGSFKTPFLLEVDDYTGMDKEVPFYVMRYIEGNPIHHFIRRRGQEWVGITGLRLLEKLTGLHRLGFIFGDLKPDNVMVSDYGQVELIDYGGVSKIGRSVKQFTEWYDRGYWNAGSRSSDEAYDLFAFAVLMIQLLNEEGLKAACAQLLPQTRNRSELLNLIGRSPKLKPYAQWLRKAVQGEFSGSREALAAWKQQIYAPAVSGRAPGKTPRWLINTFAFSVIMLGAAVYFVFFK